MAIVSFEMRQKSNTVLFKALDTFLKKAPWRMFSTMFRTKNLTEYFEWLGELSGVKEWIDERDIKSLRKMEFSVSSRTWENTIGVSKKHYKAGIEMIAPRIQQMAYMFAQHPNKLFFEFLKAGDGGQAAGGAKATYPFAGCYDTQTFFSNSHPIYDSEPGQATTNDNIVTGTGVDTVAHIVADYESGIQQFYNLKTRNGEPIFDDAGGEQISILCASEDYALFEEAFLRERDTSGNWNAYYGKVKQVIPSARLNTSTLWDVNGNQATYDQNSWFMGRTDMPFLPFLFMEVEPVSAEWYEGNKFMRGDLAYGTEAEYNLGYGFWQSIQKVYNAG